MSIGADSAQVDDDDGPRPEQLAFVELTRHTQSRPLPIPLKDPVALPLEDLEPPVLERLVAELVQRRDNRGVQFYGRRGQKQYGLDIVRRDSPKRTTLLQVRRLQELDPAAIRSAVVDYAGPPRSPAFDGEARRFSPQAFILATSAELDSDTANVDELHALQKEYDGDLEVEVWGVEAISRMLRDASRLVNAIFGSPWAEAWCGFTPPPVEGAPPSLGLVEDPVGVLNLQSLAADARSAEEDDPVRAARLWRVLAQGLAYAHFPGHATVMRQREAKALSSSGKHDDAFAILCSLKLQEVMSGATSYQRSSVARELDAMEGRLADADQAKLRLIRGVSDWCEHGLELESLVPDLTRLVDEGDADAALLCCLVLEDAIVDGLFDFDPPWSLVSETGEGASAILAELRGLAARPTTSDPVLRARLACARADAELTVDSSEADVDSAYRPLVEDALAGRYLHASALVAARAAHAFATHGSLKRAENLWRRSALAASEEGLFGDVRNTLRSLSVLDSEAGLVRFNTQNVMAALPNRRHQLSGSRDPALGALESAHNNQLPDAFGDARRYWWESRIAGHLMDECVAANLFGDVLDAADHHDGAVSAWIIGGQSDKAAGAASGYSSVEAAMRWLRSPLRRRAAAAARVVGAQATSIPDAEVEAIADSLIGLAEELWGSRVGQSCPEEEALKAIARFGIRIPPGSVGRIIDLAEPALAGRTGVSATIANLLVQVYWARPERRAEMALVLTRMLEQHPVPHNLWGLVGGMPEHARSDLQPIVERMAEAGNRTALETLAGWGHSSDAVQRRARQACAALIRRPTGGPGGLQVLGTQEGDTVDLLLALLDAPDVAVVPPEELREGSAPPAGGVIMTRTRIVADGNAAEAPVAPDPDASAQPDPDEAAVLASGPLGPLAASVAEKLMALGESPHEGAGPRGQALRALRGLFPRLSGAQNAELSARLLAVYRQPSLTDDDEWELESLDALSRARFDTGARHLGHVALIASAEAFRHGRSVGDGLAADEVVFVDELLARSVELLRDPVAQVRRHGAAMVDALARSCRGLGPMATGLLFDSDDHVRAVGARTAPLSESMIEVLLVDPAARVRAALVERDEGLGAEHLAVLESDPHLSVRRLAEKARRPTAGP